jgi:hypothetical protein
MKAKKGAGRSVRELKADALDTLVKQELASRRVSLTEKMARLKALRLARDAAEHTGMAPRANCTVRR